MPSAAFGDVLPAASSDAQCRPQALLSTLEQSHRLALHAPREGPPRVRQYAGNALVLRIIRFNTYYT